MSHSILKNSVTSPVRSMMKRPAHPRSILRRPAALPLSPNPFPFASFSTLIMSPVGKSPHVQFMASPQLVATFTTHSSDVYDRLPIKVSPNPLALPGRGDRYFSPTVTDFKLSAPPKPKAAVQKRLDSILQNAQCASPAITDFEDPRSPKVVEEVTQQVRFASFAAPSPKRSVGQYPRSPFPSEQSPRVGSADIPTRSISTEQAPRKTRGPLSFTPLPSPLQQSFKAVKTPVTAGLQRSHKPAPLALSPQDDATALSDEFWNAVSLEAETPMVTALEYLESPAGTGLSMEEVNLKSPGLQSPGPALIFGTQDGSVWSPAAAPKPTPARESLLRSALMSPGKVAFGKAKRSFIASPSPNDPFASFPSFAAVLTMAQSDPSIAYPAPAATAV